MVSIDRGHLCDLCSREPTLFGARSFNPSEQHVYRPITGVHEVQARCCSISVSNDLANDVSEFSRRAATVCLGRSRATR